MAKVYADPALFINAQTFARVRSDKKNKETDRIGKTDFSLLFDEIRNSAPGDTGIPVNLPVSEETLDFLMDEVRSTGDTLRKKPFPDEILRYKSAVRNFVNYVVQNSFELTHEAGIPNYLKANFKAPKGTPEAMAQKQHLKIRVIDERLESLAAMLLSSQRQQIEIVARLEEITGLLVDLLQ